MNINTGINMNTNTSIDMNINTSIDMNAGLSQGFLQPCDRESRPAKRMNI